MNGWSRLRMLRAAKKRERKAAVKRCLVAHGKWMDPALRNRAARASRESL